MECTCKECGMGVKGMVCAKCSEPLVSGVIQHNNQDIQVAKCPKGCGMIKSPTCCGKDMTCSV